MRFVDDMLLEGVFRPAAKVLAGRRDFLAVAQNLWIASFAFLFAAMLIDIQTRVNLYSILGVILFLGAVLSACFVLIPRTRIALAAGRLNPNRKDWATRLFLPTIMVIAAVDSWAAYSVGTKGIAVPLLKTLVAFLTLSAAYLMACQASPSRGEDGREVWFVR